MLAEAEYQPIPSHKALVPVAPAGKPGRPSRYSPQVADEILERLSAGETLRGICKSPGMPNERTVRRWALDTSHPFSPQYTRAREDGYASMADQLIDIADDKTEDPASRRVMIDTRKWLMSKALPKVYGDKTSHDVNVRVSLADFLDSLPPPR